MKKLSTLILSVLLLASCSTVHAPEPEGTIVEIGDRAISEIPISEEGNTDTYRIVQSATSGSSFKYELVKDDEFITDELPEEVARGLEWPIVVELSPNNETILYMDEWELKIYDIENKKISSLMTFLETTEGVRCIWNPKSTKVACISVNQQHYDSLTKIFVLDIENNELTKKKEYPETVQYVCGSTCYPEFWWGGDTTLVYPTHKEIEDIQENIVKEV